MSQNTYQGFPYVNLTKTEAPSLSAEEVAERAKWWDLPKKQLVFGTDDRGASKIPKATSSSSESIPPAPTVYFIPDPDESPSNQASCSFSTPKTKIKSPNTHKQWIPAVDRHREENNKQSKAPDAKNKEELPVVYVDFPEEIAHKPQQTRKASGDSNKIPVVYIDIPENNGSEISEIREEETEPEFIQETIFYDPFKDRRIDLPRPTGAGSSGTTVSSRPLPPNSLNLGSPGSSSGHESVERVPPMLSKEAQIYGRLPTPDDGFTLTPLPLDSFPSPPPYDEIDRDRDRIQVPGSGISSALSATPPLPSQTQVITNPVTPMSPIIHDNRRKLLTCQFCNATVQTLVVPETGLLTHLLAILVFFLCMPLVILVYCCSWFKYSNHYCPHCNMKIGHKNPLSCSSDITFES